jgi:hypothetical protein
MIVAVEKLRGTGQKRKFQQLRCTSFLAGSLTKALIWFFLSGPKRPGSTLLRVDPGP